MTLIFKRYERHDYGLGILFVDVVIITLLDFCGGARWWQGHYHKLVFRVINI
jgi:hypothetical protein